MAEDTKIAAQHIVDILAPALKKRKEERVELERNARNYWQKLKKRLPEDITGPLEENPEDEAAQQAFKEEIEAAMDGAQNIKMGSAIFLSQHGIEL